MQFCPQPKEQLLTIIDACRNDPAAGRSNQDNLLNDDLAQTDCIVSGKLAHTPKTSIQLEPAFRSGERVVSQPSIFSSQTIRHR